MRGCWRPSRRPRTLDGPPGSPILLLDSDIFVLLAGAGLLEEFILEAGFEVDQARRLDPLPRMLQGGRLARTYSLALRQRAEAWCNRIRPVAQVPHSAYRVLQDLVTVPGIDPGEALLFAMAIATDQARVATGDKRACQMLALATGLADARGQLRGKVICLEGALELLVRRLPLPEVVSRLSFVRDFNRTLRILLSQGAKTPGASFLEALSAYSRAVGAELGDLLFRPGRL